MEKQSRNIVIAEVQARATVGFMELGRALIELILLVVKIWVAQHLCRLCIN
jgi:hypothetical protein